ncbi:N-acetyltransferase [Rhizobium leguminosarum]|uniref:N-acetyltransferase n=1 Tax=Rhizobium leguminosarum TaxID=384 RepID=UPI00102F96B0|nr:N-acetyltransferase [Rhizobium leguminosarum]TAV49127.1 N-acetyltransferase [Rhizobium leguminosarum]TAV58489.1 N-acetyltransferase [Rhizobium leguminosarum]TAV69538.1 N-acetyltransferase [Rhizobium leguminosarum]TAX55994.1 N-acetyltransferase [Rhizobium leguminosarum]TAX60500.1 N-acetyltransferase [Rhizobium leguminosarum]
MGRKLRLTKFNELSIDDPFFESLKAGYKEFPKWFASKADEDVYVVDDDTELSGMIYLKMESGKVSDVAPPLPNGKWLKVGTLKIVGKGTKLGERVIKKIFDTALDKNATGIYVTVFEVHDSLIKLFKRYGFIEHGSKTTDNGVEIVLTRSLTIHSPDILKRYPIMRFEDRNLWLLAVYPEYHTRLLPDSILNNEPQEIVQDVSHTNTIHKIYIGKLSLIRMKKGDGVIMYRTSDKKGPAHYRSVATSICVVEETHKKKDFASIDDFLNYCRPHSVFDDNELRHMFNTYNRLYTVKMTYNVAFNKRITRGKMIEDAGVPVQPRWDLKQLTRAAFDSIVEMGKINEGIIVD